MKFKGFFTSNLLYPLNKGFFILFLSISALLSGNKAHATHAMGMDLTYTQLSQDSFLVTLAFYRDCAGVAAPNNASLRIRSASCNYNYTETLPRLGSGQETTPVCANLVTKCNGGSFPGSEEYIYQKIIVLPKQCNDWVISNFICCRNNAITTINNPGSENIYVEAKINNYYMNSSPSFSNPPVPFVCANQNYCFNNGAIDQEGDSLVYSLVTPRTGVNASDTVTFKAGFSKFDPITSSPQISLDSATGDLCMFPTDSTEIAVLAILVQEYRNGVLISSIMRDIQLRILGCPNGNNLPYATGIDSTSSFSAKVCANSNITFDIYSVDLDTGQSVTMAWNQAITTASFNVSAGPRPVGTFSWTPTMADVRNQPYCFTVTVTDVNCPFNGQQVFSYCIYVVGVAAVVDSTFNPTCFGDCDGRATVQLVNGIPPFTYNWNDPAFQTTARATGLCSGTYMITGTDSTGCATTTTVVLGDPKEMEIIMDSVSASCVGFSDGQAIVTGTNFGNPPYAYQWEVNAGLQTTDTAFNLMSGIYSVVVIDSLGCRKEDSIFVPEPPALNLAMINLANVGCTGNNDGQAMVNVSGGTAPYSYQWGTLSQNQTTDTAFNLLAGIHTVTVTDTNGCVDSNNVNITEPFSAITLSLSKTDINCTGESTGTATITAVGGTPPYNYTWDPGTGSQTTQTAINLPAGTYGVLVTDSNNCSAYPNIMITEPLSALAISPIDSFVECYGLSNGVAGVNVLGGTMPYSFQWDINAGAQTTQYASNLSAGTYKVLVNDSLGCNDSVNVQVLEADTPLSVVITHVDVSCNNGSDGMAHVDVSGGKPTYTISWDSTAGFQTGDTAFSLKAGVYQVSIVDSYGCAIDTGLTITEPPPLLTLTTFHTDVTCYGDSNANASVTVSGGTPPYLYVWSANTGGQTTDTAVGLKAGTYNVTVFDSNYCITSPDIIITEPAANLSAFIGSKDASCFNGSDGYAYVLGIGGTAPYTYTWDTLALSQTNDTAFNLSARTYSVSVADSQNCAFDTSILVSQPSAPLQINLTASPVLCFSGGDGIASVNVSGGTPPYNILWGSSAGSQTTDTALGLPSQYHTVFVNDTNNCGVLDSVFVGGPAEPLILTINKRDASCSEFSDGMAIAQGSGGTAPYTYLWDSKTGNQTNDTAFSLSAGIYTVIVTDTNQCDTSLNVTVGEPPLLRDSIFVSSNFGGTAIKCFGDSNGSATVVPIGGTAPYSFLWDSSAYSQTNDTAFNLSEGVYTVVVTDTNGCVSMGNISIGSPQQMGFTINELKNVSCFNGSDGRIDVSGFGGNAPYNYLWSTSATDTNNVLDSIPIGNYTVQITDGNGCIKDTMFTLIQPTQLVIDSLNSADALCYAQASGSSTVYASGGTAPYSYLWEISQGIFQINQTAINLGSGSYVVTVTDDQNCSASDTAFIGEPTEIVVTTSNNDTICAFQPTTISASALGGTGPYKYLWLPSTGDSSSVQSVAPNATTNYVVRALDNEGCLSAPSLVTLFVRTMANDTMHVKSNGDICLGETTSVYSFHNGPFGGYFYNWNFGGKTGFGPHMVSPDTATYYTMVVSDICGNEMTDSVLVNVFPNPVLSIDSIVAQGCDPLSVQFDDTINTLPNLSYAWDYGDGNGSAIKNPTYTFEGSGTYKVILTITSENGCTADNQESPSLVIVHPKPATDFAANPVVTDMRNPNIVFNNLTTGAASHEWEFGDGDTSSLFSPTHLYGDTGTYSVVLTSVTSNGCIDISTLDVIIRAYYTIEVPNAFTPGNSSSGGKWRNDPESNRIFYPFTEKPEAVKEFEMLIFNRWGELIFESNDIYTGWDGMYKNVGVSQEVYVYKINLKWENGQTFEKMGDVTLFR